FVSFAAVLALFSYQFYFQVFPHYFILLIPCVIILFSLWFTFENKKIRFAAAALLALYCLIIGFFVIKTTYNVVSEDKRSVQYVRVPELEKHIDSDSKLYCNGYNSVPYYFILHRKPVLFNKYGYEFGHTESEQQQLDRINTADVVIVDAHTFDYFYPVGSEVRAAMEEKEILYKDEKVMLRK
ncbi:MAG: hypothetical protein LBN23_08525, partial [Paludibacter sp.]|nr:hypothetical protein [Paludibacter sp.]